MSVMPLCRYYVQLRYSLMQVLYDTMFANLINGLPIARAMVCCLYRLQLVVNLLTGSLAHHRS